MKRTLSLMLSILLITAIIASGSISAYAEVSNTIKTKGSGTTAVEAVLNNGDMERLLENCKVEQLPKKSSYLEEAMDMYMDAGKGGAHSYKKPRANAGSVANINRGVPVSLFAIEGDWGCVSFYDHNNVKKAGWVYLENLSENYPGDTVVFGKNNLENCEYDHGGQVIVVQPELEKSKFNFVETKTKYFCIEESFCDEPCIALSFDYQVISRNGVLRAYGERDVYINSGDGWEYMGSFDVEEDFSPIRCELYFDESTNVKAIAVIPVGASAENFVSRLNMDKAYYVSE